RKSLRRRKRLLPRLAPCLQSPKSSRRASRKSRERKAQSLLPRNPRSPKKPRRRKRSKTAGGSLVHQAKLGTVKQIGRRRETDYRAGQPGHRVPVHAAQPGRSEERRGGRED